MKTKTLLLAWLLACLLPLAAMADVWQDPETKINYEYEPGSGVASVKAGNMQLAGSPEFSRDILQLNYITIDNVRYDVISIGDYAFRGNSKLNYIEIPERLVSIGNYAFSGCGNLYSIYGQWDSPVGVESIGEYAFYGCGRLMAVYNFDKLISIGKSAFYNCSGLQTFEFSDSLESIGDRAFYGCSKLDNITIPSSVTIMGEEAFRNCKNLKELILSEGLTTIGRSAFRECTSLSEITIPSSITDWKEYSFENCSKLQDVVLSEGLTEIGSSAFRYCPLTQITTPSSLISISYEAFGWCTKLKDVSLSEGLITIEKEAFKGCRSLSTISIPSSVTSIGDYSFNGCTSLTNITIPSKVNHIGNSSFLGCSGLTSITSMVENPFSISANVFSSEIYTNATLYVPQDTKPKYMATFAWNQFQSIVEMEIVSELEIDSEGFYLISSADDWKAFASLAEETPTVNAKMTADIDLSDDQTMIGMSAAYQGIFDGQGHTLTVNLVTSYSAAPFQHVEGATIENLHVKGRIEALYCAAGGIASEVYGTTTIRRCWSSSLLVSGAGVSPSHTIGGIVSSSYGVLVIEDCLFDGQFADKNTIWNGGIVANTFYDLTIRNTLNIGNYPPQSTSGTFYRTDSQQGPVILENVYYKNACGTPQGTQVTEEQLADGTVTALLQDGRSEEVWVQGDGTPVPSVLWKPVTASVTTDRLSYLPGETVSISGTTSNLPNRDIEVFVKKGGVSQTISAHTDAQGNFSAEWVPMSGQMGRFTIGASYQGTDITANPVQIDVIGLRRTSNNYITCETVVGVPFTGELEVENPGLTELHFSGVEILSKPENCEVSIDSPEAIAAGGKAMIAYTLEGTAPSAGNEWELVQLRISTVEGATLDVTLYTYCHSAQAVLVANESQINTTMAKGTSRDYPFYISNQGKGATGKIRLSLPNVAWMTAVTPVELSSLDYGETATVMLRLTPSDDLPLNVPLTGTIGMNCENGDGIAIGYAIEPVSGQTGTLTVDVVDEYTQYAESHPHVSGAAVEVLHPTTGAVIAQGLTAGEGTFSAELPEGYYAISVKAEKHEEYSGYVMVDPGREKTQEVFVSYEAITYSWSMEETEITDEYKITTTATYETNVPKPVLVITLPDKKPVPDEIFPVTVTNHGLINTEHVDLTTVINIGFTIEILNRGTLDVLGPEQSHTFYCVIKDEDGLWDSSCIDAYVVADGYYQCYGLQHVQARADMYHCNRTGSDTGGGGGSWPGTGPGGPSFGGYGTVSGGASGSTTPWISWPCESCPARVKLAIEQTVSMSRPAYRGTLTLVNGHESNPITNVRLNLTITSEDGVTATDKEFAVEVESMESFGGDPVLPGNWTLAEGRTGKATVLFIPTQDAAPDGPKKYTFSGTMNCTDPFSGQELTLPLNATTFTVQPLPNLELTYLMQRDVYGDDPLTKDIVEPTVPAEFALIINNKGNGDAKNVRILTEQPKVIENDKGLLINFAITRSQVNGDSAQLVLSPVITNDFGTIPAHSQAYAQWWLESSLLGHFISYDVSANHITNYGNANLSLIDTVTIHEMVHGFTVASDGHGQARRGWLVNDIVDADDMPDVIYFNDATKEGVRSDANASICKQGDDYLLTLNANESGWYYGSLADPTNGSLVLTDVVRMSDGAVIPTDNVWQTDRTLPDGVRWLYENRLHFVAWLPTDGDSYLLTFKTPEETGINDVAIDDNQRLRLWPLPMGEWLYVGGSFSEAQAVEIYDMRGTRRMQVRHVRPGTALHTGGLTSGLYVVTVHADGQTVHRKVLKR